MSVTNMRYAARGFFTHITMAVMEREAVTYHVEEAMKVALTVGAQRTDTDVLQIQNKTFQRNILMHGKV